MVVALRNEIYRLLKTVSGLWTNNIFYLEAPQGSALPFCVFSEFANPYAIDSGSVYEVVYVQFALFELRISPLETLVAGVKAVFDLGREKFNVSGHHVVTCMRMADLPPQKFDDVYSIVLQYKIELQKLRS